MITNPGLQKDFRYMIKQHGGMLAKGRLLGLQFLTLMTDGLYFSICKKAVEQAMALRPRSRPGASPCGGIPMLTCSSPS